MQGVRGQRGQTTVEWLALLALLVVLLAGLRGAVPAVAGSIGCAIETATAGLDADAVDCGAESDATEDDDEGGPEPRTGQAGWGDEDPLGYEADGDWDVDAAPWDAAEGNAQRQFMAAPAVLGVLAAACKVFKSVCAKAVAKICKSASACKAAVKAACKSLGKRACGWVRQQACKTAKVACPKPTGRLIALRSERLIKVPGGSSRMFGRDAADRATRTRGHVTGQTVRDRRDHPGKGKVTSKEVTGYKKGCGLDRDHLLARALGGSGSDPRNLTPVPSAFNRGAKATWEKSLVARAEAGRELEVDVRAVYSGGSKVPTAFVYQVKTLTRAPGVSDYTATKVLRVPPYTPPKGC